jgi:PPM family protein phosphatase
MRKEEPAHVLENAILVRGYRRVLEDRAEVIPVASGLVLVVADGAGGRSGGAEAADFVVQRIREAAPQVRKPHDGASWSRLLADIDTAMADDPEAGETTAVVLAVTERGIAGASAGDSGAWLIRPGGYDDLTARQRAKPFLGTSAAFPVPFRSGRLRQTLLLASDGLLKYTSPERICEVALGSDLSAAAEALVDLVRSSSGTLWDDVAVILCRPS